MKFAQQFSSQTVPEWHEAYMNYDYLKSILLDLQRFKHKKKSVIVTPPGLKRKLTFYRAFSGFTKSYNSPRTSTTSPHGAEDMDDQVLLVRAVQKEAPDENDRYESTFLMANEEGGEYELVFFRRLDDEFNKVVKFYKEKVQGVMNRAAVLNKQMDALIAFRNKVEDPDGSIDWSVEMSRLRSNVSWYEEEGMSSSPNSDRNAETAEEGRAHMDVIEEFEDSQEENSVPVSSDNNIRKSTKAVTLPHLQVLNRVKFNSTLETPRSTIKGILKKNNDHQLNFKKEELSKIEEKLKLALIAFYNELHLLKSYSSLNLMAFSKIMKKYDKITSRDASKTYLKMVDNSYLGTSNEVNTLMERVEGTFIKHFAQSNRRKGLDMLRPKAKKERHRITFSLGFFSGCTASLVVALVLVIRLRRLVEEEGASQYMENMFPLYSFFGFIVLHMLMYAMDIYLWRRYRINYPFIFGFKQGTELNDREVLLLSTGLATLALGSILSNLDMEMDSKTKDYQAFTELLPLVLVILVLLIMFCPFNIIYRSSRWFLLTCALHCLCAPLYKVTLPDFFLADQITSQVQAIRSVEFYICYYGWGDFKHRRNTCKDNSVYQTFNFIIATIPYWWRFFQCIRRFYEEKDSMQGYNGLKYFSTIIAVTMRTAYSRRQTVKWRVMAWSSSAIAAGVSTYWDLVIDWGLLQRNSRNPWLRDKLLISHKSVYFGAMVMNVLLRLAWIQTVLNFKVLPVHREALISIVASLEIIRRGIWNFFRLENEHLNNVENYRAIKSVPLPFNYLEKEDDD